MVGRKHRRTNERAVYGRTNGTANERTDGGRTSAHFCSAPYTIAYDRNRGIRLPKAATETVFNDRRRPDGRMFQTVEIFYGDVQLRIFGELVMIYAKCCDDIGDGRDAECEQ